MPPKKQTQLTKPPSDGLSDTSFLQDDLLFPIQDDRIDEPDIDALSKVFETEPDVVDNSTSPGQQSSTAWLYAKFESRMTAIIKSYQAEAEKMRDPKVDFSKSAFDYKSWLVFLRYKKADLQQNFFKHVSSSVKEMLSTENIDVDD